MELLIIEDMYKVPIPLLSRNDRFSFNYENFIRAYHVYTKVWSPLLGECLFVRINQVTEFTRMQSL